MKPRSPEKKRELVRLYRNGMTMRGIAARIGGTDQGVRSTIRKMRERGELPARPVPPHWRGSDELR